MTLITSEIAPNTMFRFNSLVLLLWSFLILVAAAVARDEPMGYGELEPALRSGRNIPIGLTEADLKALPLDDPLLRAAYATLIDTGGGPWRVDNRRPNMVAALNDLKRRGDAATPLLLDIMDKNRNTNLEDLTPFFLSAVGSFKMEPYIDYIRRVVQTRPMEINGSACEAFTMLFIGYGTDDDIKKMQELAVRRPYLASFLQRELETQKWKPSSKPQSGNADPAKAGPTTTEQGEHIESVANELPVSNAARMPEMAERKIPTAAKSDVPSAHRSERSESTHWLLWVAGAVALVVIVAFVFKRRA